MKKHKKEERKLKMTNQLFKLPKDDFFFNVSSSSVQKLYKLDPTSHALTKFPGYLALPQSQLLGLKAPNFLRADAKTTEVAQNGKVAQASTATAKENVLEWAKNDNRRLLHVVYRVGDLEKTIKYVCMELVQQRRV